MTLRELLDAWVDAAVLALVIASGIGGWRLRGDWDAPRHDAPRSSHVASAPKVVAPSPKPAVASPSSTLNVTEPVYHSGSTVILTFPSTYYAVINEVPGALTTTLTSTVVAMTCTDRSCLQLRSTCPGNDKGCVGAVNYFLLEQYEACIRSGLVDEGCRLAAWIVEH